MPAAERLQIVWPEDRAAELAGRCMLSGAVILGEGTPLSDQYEHGAVIPTRPQACPKDTLRNFLAGPDAPLSHAVELVTYSGDLPQKATEYDGEYLTNTKSSPNCITTTPNFDTNQFPAVHTDFYERNVRRLAINKGPGAAYVLLGTITIRQIVAELTARTGVPHEPRTPTVREYVATFPGRLKLLWVRLDPATEQAGSINGYVMPDGTYPHDGSTRDAACKAASDKHFWRGQWPVGHFNPIAAAAA